MEKAPAAWGGPTGALRLRASDDAAGTAPVVARLHYRLPAQDWRGAAHPSTQRAPPASPPRAPPHRFIHSVYNYSYEPHGGRGLARAAPRERAPRARAAAPRARPPRRTPPRRSRPPPPCRCLLNPFLANYSLPNNIHLESSITIITRHLPTCDEFRIKLFFFEKNKSS
ncbi:unnamed protein product [Colias eurytheme]|nr:unnamed protein product [Colias eurytheme]